MVWLSGFAAVLVGLNEEGLGGWGWVGCVGG